MLTEIIGKAVAGKTVDGIMRRIGRAVPMPEPGDGGFDAAMRQAFNMGAACMAAQIKNGPVPTKRIALMGEVARVACRARLMGLERATDGLPKFREDFAGFAATSRAHQERTEAELARMSRGMEGLQRQIAELAIHGPGQLVELPRKGSAASHD